MAKIYFLLLFFLFFFSPFPSSAATIVINEFSPASSPEWTELYSEEENASLDGYVIYFHDLKSTSQKLVLSGNMTGFFKLIETGGSWLSNNGDTLILEKNGVDEDVVSYSGEILGKPAENQSLARIPDGSSNWQIVDLKTPGLANPTPTATPGPTLSPTPSPSPSPPLSPSATPTLTPAPTTTALSLTADFEKQAKVGEEFLVNVDLKNGKREKEYYLKIRIGKETSTLTKGETAADDSRWLSDGSAWADFPKLKTDGNGNWNGNIRARVKLGSGGGGYFLRPRVKEVGEEKISDGETYSFSVDPEDEPVPTATPIPSPTPTMKLTPTQTPTGSITPSPMPTEEAEGEETFLSGEVLGVSEEGDKSGDNDEEEDEDNDGNKKVVAGGLISLGGGLIIAVSLLKKNDQEEVIGEDEED